MYVFAQFAKNMISKIDVKKVFLSIFDNPINQKRIESIIRERIYNKGVDSTGGTIRTDKAIATGRPYYAESTEKRKKRKGMRTDNVTLTESGNMFDNLQVYVSNESVRIEVNQQNVPYYVYIGLNFRIVNNAQPMDEMFFTFTDGEQQMFMNEIFMPQFKRLLKQELNKSIAKTKSETK
jgi:hypothetical protein